MLDTSGINKAVLSPNLEVFAALHQTGSSVPVMLEFDDPGWQASALLDSLPTEACTFLLETPSGPEDLARRTYLAWDPEYEIVLHGGLMRRFDHADVPQGNETSSSRKPPLDYLRGLLAAEGAQPIPYADGFTGGLIGFVSYEFKNYLERLESTVEDDLQTPELRMGFVRRIMSWDHRSNRIRLCVNVHCKEKRATDDFNRGAAELQAYLQEVTRLASSEVPISGHPQSKAPLSIQSTLTSNVSRRDYGEILNRCREHILAGDIYQANLSHRFQAPYSGSGLNLYHCLTAINPSPFATYLRYPNQEVVSCSPERLVSLTQGKVETRPIAGTRPRGANKVNDAQLESDLLASEKERAEHLMIVDMARNDIGRVCEIGSVEVESFMNVERYSHVRHLVSNVTGHLAKQHDGLNLLQAVFPGASITGVPKIRCMQVIDELEQVRRGVYTGSAGYLGLDGNLDFNILIRTFYLQDQKAYFHVGGGIVFDSDSDREYEETLCKGQALQEALRIAGSPESFLATEPGDLKPGGA